MTGPSCPGDFDATGRTHGFALSKGVFTTTIDLKGVDGTVANRVNARGRIVGYFIDPVGSCHGFLATRHRR